MRDLKVSFDKLEGQNFETGTIVLKAVFETRSVLIKTSYKEIDELQSRLREQLGNIFTDRFQLITLQQLEEFGGILIECFFDDALQCDFITHNDHFKQFFSNAQKIQSSEVKQQVEPIKVPNLFDPFNKSEVQYYQQPPASSFFFNDIGRDDFRFKRMEEDYPRYENLQKMVNQLQKNTLQQQQQEKTKQDMNCWMPEKLVVQNQQFDEEEEEEVIIMNNKKEPPIQNYGQQPQQPQIKQNQIQTGRNKKIQQQENIYLNNRALLEEKIHSDKKHIRFSRYFRQKIKQKLKFLFKQRDYLRGQSILNCFNCCKCHKNIYFGIKCFKCKRNEMYYCEDCNTKCRFCNVLLKKTNNHTNIICFYQLLSSSFVTCKACYEEFSLIKYEEHLYQCEENLEVCKYCNFSFHFSGMKEHVNKYCEQKPVVCQVCHAKYPKCKQTSHRCLKRFRKLHNELLNGFEEIKESVSSKYNNLEEKLKQLQQSNSSKYNSISNIIK